MFEIDSLLMYDALNIDTTDVSYMTTICMVDAVALFTKNTPNSLLINQSIMRDIHRLRASLRETNALIILVLLGRNHTREFTEQANTKLCHDEAMQSAQIFFDSAEVIIDNPKYFDRYAVDAKQLVVYTEDMTIQALAEEDYWGIISPKIIPLNVQTQYPLETESIQSAMKVIRYNIDKGHPIHISIDVDNTMIIPGDDKTDYVYNMSVVDFIVQLYREFPAHFNSFIFSVLTARLPFEILNKMHQRNRLWRTPDITAGFVQLLIREGLPAHFNIPVEKIDYLGFIENDIPQTTFKADKLVMMRNQLRANEKDGAFIHIDDCKYQLSRFMTIPEQDLNIISVPVNLVSLYLALPFWYHSDYSSRRLDSMSLFSCSIEQIESEDESEDETYIYSQFNRR